MTLPYADISGTDFDVGQLSSSSGRIYMLCTSLQSAQYVSFEHDSDVQ